LAELPQQRDDLAAVVHRMKQNVLDLLVERFGPPVAFHIPIFVRLGELFAVQSLKVSA
jgi:hypothetical protein